MKSIFSVFLFVALSASAQSFNHSCDAKVFANPSSLLSSSQGDTIVHAVDGLIAKGADPRVILDNTVGMMPEQYVAALKNTCPSWQSAGGGVKNNLIVFLVFPYRHKMGLFVGEEFGKAINTSTIRSQFMAPAFKDGDWARGMVAGINQAGIQIEAFQTAALHPSTTVVKEEATDLSGLWKWLDALLVLGFVIGIIVGVLYLRRKRAEVRNAQQRAIQARSDAAEKVIANPSSSAAETYARLSGSETFNPDTNGLTIEQYNAMGDKYNNIVKSFDYSSSSKPHFTRRVHSSGNGTPVTPAASSSISPFNSPSASSQAIEHHNTTIVNESYSPTYVPVIVEEPYVAPYREPKPSYSAPSSGWDSSSSSSSFDSGSSWSDSSSSSDFGSSGGSDFGGGSSDF